MKQINKTIVLSILAPFILVTATAQPLRQFQVKEIIDLFDKTQTQVYKILASKFYSYEGNRAGYDYFVNNTDIGSFDVTVAFKNQKLTTITTEEISVLSSNISMDLFQEGFEITDLININTGREMSYEKVVMPFMGCLFYLKNYKKKLRASLMISPFGKKNAISINYSRFTKQDYLEEKEIERAKTIESSSYNKNSNSDSGGNGTGGNSASEDNGYRNQLYKPGNGDAGSPNGNPDSYGNSPVGRSGVSVVRGLSGRRPVHFPNMEDDFNENAKVYVDIQVNAAGTVTSAVISRGTTTSNLSLRNTAIEKAKELKFPPAQNDVENGTLLFDFLMKMNDQQRIEQSNTNLNGNDEEVLANQKLFIPDSVINNPNLNRYIKKVIETKERKFKIDKIVRYDGSYVYSITKKGKGTMPIYAYGTKENSYVVNDFTHWANVDVKTVTEFYKNCGFEEYKNTEDGNKTIRLVNEDKSIFIQIQKLTNSKSFIVISTTELSDEDD